MAYRARDEESVQYPSAGAAWYALICLLAATTSCTSSIGIILTLLVAPVRRDLAINDLPNRSC